jgi:hypothetical protein
MPSSLAKRFILSQFLPFGFEGMEERKKKQQARGTIEHCRDEKNKLKFCRFCALHPVAFVASFLWQAKSRSIWHMEVIKKKKESNRELLACSPSIDGGVFSRIKFSLALKRDEEAEGCLRR